MCQSASEADMSALLDQLTRLGGGVALALESHCLSYLTSDCRASEIFSTIEYHKSALCGGLPPFGRQRVLLIAAQIHSALLIGKVFLPSADSNAHAGTEAEVESIKGMREELIRNIQRLGTLSTRRDAVVSPPSLCAVVVREQMPEAEDEIRLLHESSLIISEDAFDMQDTLYCASMHRLASTLEVELLRIFASIDITCQWKENGPTNMDVELFQYFSENVSLTDIETDLSTRKRSMMEVERELISLLTSKLESPSSSDAKWPNESLACGHFHSSPFSTTGDENIIYGSSRCWATSNLDSASEPSQSWVLPGSNSRSHSTPPHLRRRHESETNDQYYDGTGSDGSCLMMMPSDEKSSVRGSPISRGSPHLHNASEPYRRYESVTNEKYYNDTGSDGSCLMMMPSDERSSVRGSPISRGSPEANFESPAEEECASMNTASLNIDCNGDGNSIMSDLSGESSSTAPPQDLGGSYSVDEESLNDVSANDGELEQGTFSADYLLRYLTEDEREALNFALYSEGSLDYIMATFGRDSCQRVSLRRLRPGVWINDEIVNIFMALLADRDATMSDKNPQRSRCHFFRSYFMSGLLGGAGGYNYSNVRRWGDRVPGRNIFELDQVFVPINIKGLHWALAVVDITNKEIRYYDSMNGDGKPYLAGLLRYLEDEHMRKKGHPLRKEEWNLFCAHNGTPQQENAHDCGIFVCMFCEFLSLRKTLVFTQDHISRCRQRIAVSIMKGFLIE